MTEDELKRIEDEGCGCVIASGYGCAAEALVAEVRRLQHQLAAMYAITRDAHRALGDLDDGQSTLAQQIERLRAQLKNAV